MHTLYKRKKTLLLVALCCMSSLDSFMSTVKASSSEDTSSRQEAFALSTLDPKIQSIVKSKEKEYGSIQAYYGYRGSWSQFYLLMVLELILGFFVKKRFDKKSEISEWMNNISINQDPYHLNTLEADLKRTKIRLVILTLSFLYCLYSLIVMFSRAKYPGAIFLTDRGILYIDCGYNGKHEFILYKDIKQVQLDKYMGRDIIKIEFVKGNGEVNTISIKKEDMPDPYAKEFQNLYKKLSEKTKQEST